MKCELEICEYCTHTDYGTVEVNTGPYNLCEGRGCKDAIETYEEETGRKWEG